MKRNIGLYIHIPFCKSKCLYCDFNSYAGEDYKIPAYFNVLQKEIGMYREILKSYTVDSIYIGGGTPSFVDVNYIYDVLNACNQNYSISSNAEITIESNPGTLTLENLVSYKSFGINRLSIGLQACQDEILKKIGRIHTNKDFVQNYHMAREAGINNINIDLMFGLPDQSMDDWEETISNVIQLNPDHISCYSLIIEKDTKFSKLMDEGLLNLPSEENEREMYNKAIKKLTANEYNHYEISNFSKANMECRQNLKYWHCLEYAGIGAGAHSYLNNIRYWNSNAIEEYILMIEGQGQLPTVGREHIDENESTKEFIILGLRMINGVSKEEFKHRFNRSIETMYFNQIQKVIEMGLLEDIGDRLKLTEKGLDLANEVLMEFI